MICLKFMSKKKINPEKWGGKTHGKRFQMGEWLDSLKIEHLVKARG